MKKLLVGIAIGVCLPLVAGYLFVRLGGMPVAAKGVPLPFERMIAKMAIRAAVAKEAGRASPVPADETNLMAGAEVYREQCAVCHGLPNSTRTAIAKGLFPKPPQFFLEGEDVSDDPVGETFWKARNGMRLTGMPGFVDSLSEPELWQVSLLLATEKLTPPVRNALSANQP